MQKFKFDFSSIRTQMILSTILLVIVGVVATGLPAIVLNHEQMNIQAWTQLDHGVQTARAIYSANRNELINLATLTSQRPTLHQLIRQEDAAGLISYLADIQTGAEVDMIVVCNSAGEIIAQTTKEKPAGLCLEGISMNYLVVDQENECQVWFLASHVISFEEEDLGHVLIGTCLDKSYSLDMQSQIGLEHSIYINNHPVATSLDIELEDLDVLTRKIEDNITLSGLPGTIFEIYGDPFYATRFLLNEQSLEAEIALQVGEIVAAQRNLAMILIGSVITAATSAIILGTVLSRRISNPLEHLADIASQLPKGNLDASIAVETSVKEVSAVAGALEEARVDLTRTLTDLQKERDWSEHLLESVVEGIVTLDEKDCIQYFSSGAERITGWKQDLVLNQHIDDFFKLVEENQDFSSQIPSSGEKQIIVSALAGGRVATLAITGAKFAPSEAGQPQVVLVIRDVSEEEAMSHLLGQFIGNVAHEFRTPLSALAASIEMLLDQSSDLSQDEVQELLTSLHIGILGLETLIDNLLEGANIEAKRFRVSPHPSDLRNILTEAIQTINPLLIKHGQKIAINLPTSIPLVQADPKRTAQVLVNLLSNASKYGPSDEEITIEIKIAIEQVKVMVADRGPGIPKAYKNDLFTRFVYPVNEVDHAKAGVGLGLSVVKAIVEAQHGEVGVEDRLGGGAIFWFTIPKVSKL